MVSAVLGNHFALYVVCCRKKASQISEKTFFTTCKRQRTVCLQYTEFVRYYAPICIDRFNGDLSAIERCFPIPQKTERKRVMGQGKTSTGVIRHLRNGHTC